MDLLTNILIGVYVFDALLMMLVILMQRPKSEGLGAAFGGGVTENIFGAQTTNVLTKVTGWLAAIFFLLTFILSILYAHKNTPSSNLSRELTKGATPAPVVSATPVPGISVSPAPASSTTPSGTPAGSATPAPGVSVSPAPSVANSAVPTASVSVAPAASIPAASPQATAAPSASPKR
ncbi:MAG TPA: preprotein translocase subunit SecG [Chthoniobacterales bacterium]|jgi:preprotein translocase subunit SecG|nr:preprotein translocase subunit SecG [Chthoniobacterales bacterium]